MLAFLQDITWAVVVALVIIFAAFCFLAVLWSRREWKSRKIRVGMFLEREYDREMEAGSPPPAPPLPPSDEADTKEMNRDAW